MSSVGRGAPVQGVGAGAVHVRDVAARRGAERLEVEVRVALLERNQKTRAKRRHLDVVDRGLMDLASVYRDAIALATRATATLVNEEMRGEIGELARRTSPEDNLRRIDRIFTAREQMLEFNVPPALALESMMVGLRLTDGGRV